MGYVNTAIEYDGFKLPELPQGDEPYLALRWYLAGLAAEADLPAPRWPVADGEFPESAQLEAESVFRQISSGGNGGTAEFHLDSLTGPLVATAALPITGSWETWETVTASVSGASGVHDLYVVFKGTGSISNLNWFEFNP